MKLILMTTPYFFVEEHQILRTLFDEGLDVLHLRKPDSEMAYNERLLTLLPDNYRRRVVTHQYFHLKNEYKLRGIHLTSRTAALPPNYRGHISASVAEIAAAKDKKSVFDYLFLGPLYDSNLPENIPGKLLGHAELLQAAKEGVIDKKIMAVGNVTLDNIPELKVLGFGGVVIWGDLWNKFNMHTAQDYRELINHFKLLKKAAD